MMLPCPCCGNPEAEVDQNGFCNCPTTFSDITDACPMYAVNSEQWDRLAKALSEARTGAEA